MNPSDEAAAARARQLTEPGAAAPRADEPTLALAWALKALCYQAWNTEPPRATRAADVLGLLPVGALPPEQARQVHALAHWTAGIAFLIQGRMNDAVRAFDQAAAGLRAAALPDAAAQTQVPKIMALAMLGRHADAAACAEAAQRELRALGNLPAAARVSQNLAGMQLHAGQAHDAVRHYREAAVLFARLGEHEQSVLADIGLGDALTALGDFDEAMRYYARARMRAGHQGLARPLALAESAVALVELTRGRYREALAGFESARRRHEALGLPANLAIAEKQLADAYVEVRLLPEAWALLDRVAGQFQRLESPLEEAAALAQRGRAEALMGRPSAGGSLAAAAALFDAQGHEAGSAAVALTRAELALAQGDPSSALALANAAAAGFERTGQADGAARAQVLRAEALLGLGDAATAGAVFEATLVAARERQQLPVQVRCLTGQGRVAHAAGDAARAQAAFEAAIELFEDQRRALPSDELRSAFLTDQLRPYLERLRCAVDAGDAAEALAQLERCRARSLAQRIDEAGHRDNDDDESIALRARLNWLYRRVQRLYDEGDHSAALEAELLQTERTLLERARRERLGAAPAAGAESGPFRAAALQAALGPAEAVVEYGVLDDELFACVVTGGGVVLVRSLALWPKVLEAVQATRFQLDTLRHGSAAVQAHLPRLAQRLGERLRRLHGLLWAPLGGALAGVQRVVVVPHAQLGSVPFAALTDGQAFLGEQLEIALAPSARMALRGCERVPVAARSVLALGESSRLAHAAVEARAVAAQFAASRCFVDADASLATLQAHAAEADVLHLACHGQFRGDNPRFSALHLGDGVLTVEQAEALVLRAGTVVLSACETALADAATGDEMVGLVRAFLVAGAARVVGSLWPVDDAVTAAFMDTFYRALVQGETAAASLRAAQAATRRTHPHPSFWAAFTLYGGW